MTLEDMLAREAIRDTLAKYTMAGDRLRIGDFVSCFTEDAVIESERVPADRLFRYEGRAAIQAWQERWLRGEGGTHGATFVRHHLSTSRIVLEGPDSASARTYWAAWTDIGPDHAGYYLDTFRKAGEDWLIAHRRVRMDWEAENSLFRKAVPNSKG
ncbi:nuclear transport factor 2 family protein [Novosphingobium beihaiensis]|uniref:Nuclear transport factor 2 family protein n=1 Tax=Novosphingobium beihaiensis TaxID=2930389 RepID=A0ABT0BS12_9SPHN|nr:nuclear transport factor 2 family protein [Novosphingobium beihaiensis]MCJ2187811.1 nuclear transport factor 2 family protein [Novosphingobium beihaiensis]